MLYFLRHDFDPHHGGEDGPCFGIMSHPYSNGVPRPNLWSTCSNDDIKDFYMKTGYKDHCLKPANPTPTKGKKTAKKKLIETIFNQTKPWQILCLSTRLQY